MKVVRNCHIETWLSHDCTKCRGVTSELLITVHFTASALTLYRTQYTDHATGAQNKKVRVRVLGRGIRSKNKLQSPPQADRHRKPTNAVAKRLGRQMGAAHRKCTRVGSNCRDLAIGN